jgi:hypothetical protein
MRFLRRQPSSRRGQGSYPLPIGRVAAEPCIHALPAFLLVRIFCARALPLRRLPFTKGRLYVVLAWQSVACVAEFRWWRLIFAHEAATRCPSIGCASGTDARPVG